MSKPFAGVKVVDFTRVLAGPYSSYQLALLGADVIKIESRDGDDMRFGTRSNDWEKRGLAAPWVAVNGNKRSITLDLKQPKAIEVVSAWSRRPTWWSRISGRGSWTSSASATRR